MNGSEKITHLRGANVLYHFPKLNIIGDYYRDTPRKISSLTLSLFTWENNDTCVPGMSSLLWLSEVQSITKSNAGRYNTLKRWKEDLPLKTIKQYAFQALMTRPFNKWEEAFWKKRETLRRQAALKKAN